MSEKLIKVPHYDPQIYETGTTRLFHEYLKVGDSCVIAGAHQGYFTTLAASIIGPQGRVYAFEPEPHNFALLKTKTEPFDNVRLYDFALGERATISPLFFNMDNDGGHALWDVGEFTENVKTRNMPRRVQVAVKRLDDVLEDEDVRNLKLCLFDVEGAEHSLLKGAINTLVDYKVPYVITEINNPALNKCHTSQMAVRSFMSVYGYRPYFINDDNVEFIPPDQEVNLYCGDENTIQAVFNVLFKLTAK